MAQRRKSVTTLSIAISMAIAAAVLYWPVDISRATPSPALLAEDGTLLRAFPAPDGQMRLPLDIKDVDPVFIKMLIGYEDKRFNNHPGIDPLALTRAAQQWMQAGKIISGGSTLSMQVARLLDPSPRTVFAKAVEMLRALRLERQYSKTEILSLYLRLAPYGGNIVGLRAAALVYFDKEPRNLLPDEAALLVVLPQNPNRFRPDRFPEAATTARRKVLQRLRDDNFISDAAYQAGDQRLVPSQRHDLPRLAPHLADRFVQSKTVTAPWHVTIDTGLQSKVEKTMLQQLSFLPPRVTAAALIVDNKTHTVKAYIGNADYFSTVRQGQVDMVTAIRSPGSTLKPFLYGMAFQDGIALPETVIRDDTVRFGDYMPSNFNQGVTGDVTIRDALQQSLNIPAVKILDRIGPQRFVSRMAAGGGVFRLPDGSQQAELPVILGGLGTRLWDLTALYSGLANGGMVQPLLLQKQDSLDAVPPYALLDPRSSALVTDILLGAPLADGVSRGINTATLALKTGTSYGYRDAWAMAYRPDYTISVWVGRADGTPVPGLVGRRVAVPLLLAIQDALPTSTMAWPTLTENAADQIPAALRRWKETADKKPSLQTSNRRTLSIRYPVDESVYSLRDISEQGIRLTANGGIKPYHWYVNGQLISSTAEQEAPIWHPTSDGFYKIALQDGGGETTHISLSIEHIP